MGDRLLDHQATFARPAAEVKNWRTRGRGREGHRPGRGDPPGAAHHADRHVGNRGRVHRVDCQRDGPAYRPAHYFPAFQSACARGGHSSRSDRLDRWPGLDRHRQPVHAGHSQRNHPCHRPDGERHVVPWPGPRYDCVPGRLVSVGMLAAAANALSSLVAVRLPGASLFPHVDDLRSVTVTVAVAVAEAAVAEGLAAVELATSFNKCKTRCGSRSIAESKHHPEAFHNQVMSTGPPRHKQKHTTVPRSSREFFSGPGPGLITGAATTTLREFLPTRLLAPRSGTPRSGPPYSHFP